MKEGKYEALDIALYTINKCLEIGRPISNLQLQKILYYEQGYYIAIKNRPLFDDNIVAWKWGVIVKSVYREYRIFSNKKLGDEVKKKRFNQEKIDKINSLIPNDDKKIIDKVIFNYSQYTAIELSMMTRSEEPYISTYPGEIIIKGKIQDFLKNK